MKRTILQMAGVLIREFSVRPLCLIECWPMPTPDTTSTSVEEPKATAHQILDTSETTCCIVGAGPGGAVLALSTSNNIKRKTKKSVATAPPPDVGKRLRPSVKAVLILGLRRGV